MGRHRQEGLAGIQHHLADKRLAVPSGGRQRLQPLVREGREPSGVAPLVVPVTLYADDQPRADIESTNTPALLA